MRYRTTNMHSTDFVLNGNPSVFAFGESTSLEGELTEGQERLAWAIHKGGMNDGKCRPSSEGGKKKH